ncbi:MAG: 23S rRNA (guanosine(2251)-2'-O)-methyltransferase RlmB [Acidobacteria bacterium]|nr:23S rRNA (guanosine(2251)-2'-O)-methyltransferase RlmB [Acidobacteriota bacterium]
MSQHEERVPDANWLLGVHAVTAALEAGRPMDLVWIQRGRRDRRLQRIVELAAERGVPVRFVPRTQLERMAAGGAHNGVGARTAPRSFTPLEELLRPGGEPGRLILLDGVTDPHNVGAVIRSAAAFGIDGVILAGPGVPPLGGALAAAAAGHLERVPMARAGVAGDTLRILRDAGYWAYGAQAGGTPLWAVDPPDRWVLALGSEGKGLRAKTRAFLDDTIAIPMKPGVESLNVSVAAAILAYALTEAGRDGQ